MDISAMSLAPLRSHDSNLGQVLTASGGVGRNIAVAIKRLGCDVQLLTAIADDANGNYLANDLKNDGIDLVLPLLDGNKYRSGVYVYMVDADGTLVYGINDMGINEDLTSAKILFAAEDLKKVDCVVFETNIPKSAIDTLVNMNCKLAADCVSVVKARKLKGVLDKLFLLKANYAEACELAGMKDTGTQDPYAVAQKLAGKGLQRGLITLGKYGAFCFDVHAFENGGFEWYKVDTPKDGDIINTNGCGDAFFAGFLKSYLTDNDMKKALEFGQKVASANARSTETISKELFSLA